MYITLQLEPDDYFSDFQDSIYLRFYVEVFNRGIGQSRK